MLGARWSKKTLGIKGAIPIAARATPCPGAGAPVRGHRGVVYCPPRSLERRTAHATQDREKTLPTVPPPPEGTRARPADLHGDGVRREHPRHRAPRGHRRHPLPRPYRDRVQLATERLQLRWGVERGGGEWGHGVGRCPMDEAGEPEGRRGGAGGGGGRSTGQSRHIGAFLPMADPIARAIPPSPNDEPGRGTPPRHEGRMTSRKHGRGGWTSSAASSSSSPDTHKHAHAQYFPWWEGVTREPRALAIGGWELGREGKGETRLKGKTVMVAARDPFDPDRRSPRPLRTKTRAHHGTSGLTSRPWKGLKDSREALEWSPMAFMIWHEDAASRATRGITRARDPLAELPTRNAASTALGDARPETPSQNLDLRHLTPKRVGRAFRRSHIHTHLDPDKTSYELAGTTRSRCRESVPGSGVCGERWGGKGRGGEGKAP